MCGVADKCVQDHYLRESKLTYEEALEMAQAAETATKDSQKLHSNGYDDSPSPVVDNHREETVVQHISGVQTTKSRFSRKRSSTTQKGSPTSHREPQCYRCGSKHDPTRCRFKHYVCNYCKKKGRLEVVCRKKQADNAQSTEQAHRVEVAPSRREEHEYTMYHVCDKGSSRPLKSTLC